LVQATVPHGPISGTVLVEYGAAASALQGLVHLVPSCETA
jgi:hypothetical protein